VAFLQIPAYVALIFLGLWGLYLTVRNIVKFKAYKQMDFAFWAMAFVALNIITILVNMSQQFLINLLMVIFMAVCFFVFYGANVEGLKTVKHELYTVARLLLYIVTSLQIAGIFCLLVKISYHNEWMDLIIYENRFTGLFINPNLTGFCSVVVIFFIHLLLIHNFDSRFTHMSRISRIWLSMGLIINLITLFLCDSNSSMVLFLGYVIVFVITKFISSRNDYNKKQLIVRFCSTILAGVVIICCTFLMRTVCQAGMAALINSQNQIVVSESDMAYSTLIEEDTVTFEHENQNIDSGRFTLWSQAMTIFSHYPIIGIGKGNLLEYSYQFFKDGMHFADLYSGDFSGLFASFTTDIHNAYITILVCSGILGFLLFMAFSVRNGFAITKFLFKAEKSLDKDIFPCLFSFTVSYLVFACFEKAVLYDISFMVIIFWFVLGQIMCYNVRNISHNKDATFKENIKQVLL
jgi:O-antigen ligase